MLRLILEICDEAQAIVAAETMTKLGDIEHPPVEVGVDNKGAYDLCHRTTAGKNSRHVERKVFKMRELRHVGKVRLTLVPTAEMRADMLTKPLDDETFARHRDAMMNTSAETLGVPTAPAVMFMNARKEDPRPTPKVRTVFPGYSPDYLGSGGVLDGGTTVTPDRS